MKEFTEEDLAQYNDRNGKPAYVAYEGKIFDVSESFLWKDGVHEVLHSAGLDLTAALEQAPHSSEALERFPIVGIVRKPRTDSSPSKSSFYGVC